jgi:uncharacterized protein YndB with AHSA1/START domain
MSRNHIHMDAPPEAVFAVIDDPYAYARWVVGSRRIRAVDPGWPEEGTRFHHAIGTAAGEVKDSSKVLEHDPPRRMTLEVRVRPAGTAIVDIRVRPERDGSEVSLEELPKDGPLGSVPRAVSDPLLALRNEWSLRRLRRLVEQEASHGRGTTPRP